MDPCKETWDCTSGVVPLAVCCFLPFGAFREPSANMRPVLGWYRGGMLQKGAKRLIMCSMLAESCRVSHCLLSLFHMSFVISHLIL